MSLIHPKTASHNGTLKVAPQNNPTKRFPRLSMKSTPQEFYHAGHGCRVSKKVNMNTSLLLYQQKDRVEVSKKNEGKRWRVFFLVGILLSIELS
ncbi:hypothetical protein [Neobacillus jeddahensis]|uniref:hypothetical protein n=1 Tax=Neobacillus jeddahensis TaxID=1461580 RepID=UPI00058C2609|nr:hypothetical protein [Neobacillus jeddahensis]